MSERGRIAAIVDRLNSEDETPVDAEGELIDGEAPLGPRALIQLAKVDPLGGDIRDVLEKAVGAGLEEDVRDALKTQRNAGITDDVRSLLRQRGRDGGWDSQ